MLLKSGYVHCSIEPLWRHLLPPTAAPTLALLALPWRVVPFPLAQLQARWLARVLSGSIAPPTLAEMKADSAAFYKEQQQHGRRSRDAHYLGENQWGYNEWLARSCGEAHDIASTSWRIAMNNQVCQPSSSSLVLLEMPDPPVQKMSPQCKCCAQQNH